MAESVNAAEFQAFAAKLKTADRKLKARLRRRIRQVALAEGPEIVQEGADGLPGGLAEHVVAKGARPTVSTTATGVRLVLGKKAGPQIGKLDEGSVRHPTYGRPPWVEQAIPAGAFTEAIEKRADKLREGVAKEVESIMKELG